MARLSESNLEILAGKLREFVDDREWSALHSPKNLSMALAGEAGELLAVLQWLNDDEIDEQLKDVAFRSELGDEVADVFIYLIRFADVCGFDLISEAERKIKKNELHYPVELSKGSPRKYTSYIDGAQD